MKVVNSIIALLAVIAITIGAVSCGTKKTESWYRENNLPAIGAETPGATYTKGALLHLKDEDGRPMCTAFVIDDNYAITAAHCVYGKGGQMIKATDLKNISHLTTKVVGYYARGDYALLQSDFTQYARLAIVYKEPVANALRGSMVFSCGFPLGQTEAVCTTAQVLGPSSSAIVAKGEMYPGSSGGPVIDPNTNMVIGLNTATLSGEMPVDLLLFSPLTGLAGALNVEPKEKS